MALIRLNKAVRICPFIALALVLSYTWYTMLATEYYATVKPQVTAALFLLNSLVYFLNFRFGIFLTGVILFAGSFDLLAFLPEIVTHSYYFRIGKAEITLPGIQWQPMLLFIFYLIVNIKFLLDWYYELRRKTK